MSFLTTQPEELAAAAGKLETIGSAMVAQNAAAAALTTTGVIPAAADEISVLQAPLFTAYGTLYQQVSAEAAAVYDLFVKTLGSALAPMRPPRPPTHPRPLRRCRVSRASWVPRPGRCPPGFQILPISSTLGLGTGSPPRRTC